MGAALTVLPLAIAAGARLTRRFEDRHDPADLLAPLLGLLAVTLPATLLLLRTVRPALAMGNDNALSLVAIVGSGLFAFTPLGLCLGLGLTWVAAVAARKGHAKAPALPLPVALAAAGTLGAIFVQFVAIPKLTPLNACLDMGIGCSVAGLLCAAGAPGGRRMETWLSLLALAFVLLLPVSGLIDMKLQAFEWQCPITAIPVSPDDSRAVLAHGPDGGRQSAIILLRALALATLLTGTAAVLGRLGRLPGLDRDAGRAAAAGMAEATTLVGILFAYQTYVGSLYTHLATLAAAFLAGQGLALYHHLRREDQAPALAPCLPHLLGAAIGCGVTSLLLFL